MISFDIELIETSIRAVVELIKRVVKIRGKLVHVSDVCIVSVGLGVAQTGAYWLIDE